MVDPSTHLSLLDSFAGHKTLLVACGKHYAAWREAAQNLEALEASANKAAEDRAFLEHAIAELSRLDPKDGEEQKLAESRQFLQAAEGAVSELSQAQTALSEAGVVEGQLGTILSSLERLSDKLGDAENAASSALSGAFKAIERALLEFQEARQAVDVAANSFDFEPGELDRIERRLFDLRGAARKFGVTVTNMPSYRVKLAHQLEQAENISSNIDAARKQAAKAEQDYYVAADELSKSRKAAALKLDQHVISELPALKMDRAQFSTQIEDSTDSALGRDKVRFIVATNPGSAMGHLDKVASGGEMSRFALAIKVALAGQSAPVMVFDQVFVVTHSPQVAAKASHQYRIDKQSDDAVTTTHVIEVQDAQREEEIARMLAGEVITDEARAAARKLMQAA